MSTRKSIIQYAVVAIAEARVAARIATGDAANAAPTKLQADRIAAAEALPDPMRDTREICEQMTFSGVMLYAADRNAPAAKVLEEIRRLA